MLILIHRGPRNELMAERLGSARIKMRIAGTTTVRARAAHSGGDQCIGSAAWLLLVACLLIAGCQSREELVELAIGDHVLFVEVARSPEEQQKGLMHRKDLAADRGMLFAYDRDDRRRFWMKNTRVPLSIAFISSEGVITEIQDLTPLSLRSVVSRYSVRYALEVNQGYFERIGVGPGARITLPPDLP